MIATRWQDFVTRASNYTRAEPPLLTSASSSTEARRTVIARSIDRTGWHTTSAFALPNRIIGSSSEQLVWAADHADVDAYVSRGALSD